MVENRCKFWLPKKNRLCANLPLNNSPFCGNHTQRSDDTWIPCPIDPSHSVLQENLDGHLKKCPFLKQAQSLSDQPFYQKGINAGKEEEEEEGGETLIAENNGMNIVSDNVTSEMKRNAVHSMSVAEFYGLIRKIESIHGAICTDIRDSYKKPDACGIWINREVDRKLPFQEKHVAQQASILGNMEEFGLLKDSVDREHSQFAAPCLNDDVPAVVEFGAGRGYLTQTLADCYGIKRVFLVERKSYKLKADRSLRQKEQLILERLRIDIEDLNLSAVEALRRVPYLAIGKHLCGPATDLTLRCCLAKRYSLDNVLKGLAIATCCHHLCQWKHYINKKYLSTLGISKEEFHSITWFTSWAVDADHGSDLSDVNDNGMHLESIEKKESGGNDSGGVQDIVKNMIAVERAALGFKCKQIIDTGRLMWIKDCGLETQLCKYVPSTISPENHLLIARHASKPVKTPLF